MRLFHSAMMLAVVSLSLSACSSSYDKDMGYLGSRDDIIINNQTASNTVSIEKEGIQVATKEAVQTLETAPMGTVDMLAPADVTIETAQKMENVAPAAATSYAPPAPLGSGDIPPNARPGECYAKVLIPAVTETLTDRIQVSEEQRVLTRIVPAQYRVQQDRILVREGRSYWKQGRGPVEKMNQLTGEILCLVEEPPLYKTIEKRVLVSPEQPEYKMVPAQFESVSKTQIMQAERLEWRRILCDTNVTPKIITRIQQSLQAKGYKVGPIDGTFGAQTLSAINQYQLKNDLATRGITYDTLNHLGVSLTSGI